MVKNMIERHYTDEALISLIETNRAAADRHLPACEPCSAKIESFRMIADALCDQETWDRPAREPVPATIANLRAFAEDFGHHAIGVEEVGALNAIDNVLVPRSGVAGMQNRDQCLFVVVPLQHHRVTAVMFM